MRGFGCFGSARDLLAPKFGGFALRSFAGGALCGQPGVILSAQSGGFGLASLALRRFPCLALAVKFGLAHALLQGCLRLPFPFCGFLRLSGGP